MFLKMNMYLPCFTYNTADVKHVLCFLCLCPTELAWSMPELLVSGNKLFVDGEDWLDEECPRVDVTQDRDGSLFT